MGIKELLDIIMGLRQKLIGLQARNNELEMENNMLKSKLFSMEIALENKESLDSQNNDVLLKEEMSLNFKKSRIIC